MLASAYEDDETLKKMTNEEFAGLMASEDTKEGSHCVHREAGTQLEGRVAGYSRVETMILRAVIPARS